MPKPKPAGLDKPYVDSIMRTMTRANVWLYRTSGGRLGGRWWIGDAFRKGGLPLCLLTTTGRKSGEPRTCALLFLRDDDRLVVVGSKGGTPRHPQWYLNLCDTPDCEVQLGREHLPCRARVAEGEERAALWTKLVDLYADFESYAAWTERTIPVVVLEPRAVTAAGDLN